MNYYNEIKNKLIDNEIYSKVKDYSKERHKVITYFEVGKLLDEAGSKYGDNILNDYSKQSTHIRLQTKLSWSHYSELLSIKDENELIYYINIAYEKNLSKRELREILHKALLDVNFPKGANGTSLSSVFIPNADIYAPICSSEHENTFAPTDG